MLQFQYLADKYAPAAPEIADTLSKLQLPPHTSLDNTSPVPLPQRSTQPSQHHLAVVIRDGRRAASRLAASLGDASKTTVSSKDTFSHQSNDDVSSMSTALEQDFTVQGKKSALQCPFQPEVANTSQSAQNVGSSHYDPSDPICAALADGASSSHAATGNGTSAPSKCPIRYLDKHTPEEVARYVEMHKHELPRSHEVCLRRYGRNEREVRKLDSKYGNIASMIEDLGQLHQSMLPEDELPPAGNEADEGSNRRVENWANGVNPTTDPDDAEDMSDPDHDRQSHFDRPLKEVRVGESPSRPWGISVPIYDADDRDAYLLSPPAAPLKMPTPHHPPAMPEGGPKKCPFDHTKFAAFAGASDAVTPKPGAKDGPGLQGPPPMASFRDETARPSPAHGPPPPQQQQQQQPIFVAPDAFRGKSDQPQMVFTGPVFIGYPMDQALQFMSQFQRQA